MRIRRSFLLTSPLVIICMISLFTLLLEPSQAEGLLTPSTDTSECFHRISTWESGATAPSNHMEGSAALVNDKLYIASGFASYDTTLHTSTVMDVYNPMIDVWETSTNPVSETPPGRSHIQGATDGRYLWFAGGYTGDHPGPPTKEVWRYDTVNDVWWQGPDLPQKRASAGLVVVGRELHFLGGLSGDRQTDYADHWVLNLDNPVEWVEEPALPRARNHFQAVAIGNILYAVAGVTGHDGPHIDRPWLEAYDTTTNTWSELADMPKGRSHAEMGTFVLDNRIIIAGGRSENTEGTDTEGQVDRITEYNPATNTWRQIGTLPKRMISPLVFTYGGKIIASMGGIAWNIPQKNTWIADIVIDCGYGPGNPDPTGGIYRVNAGGPSLFINGQTWEADNYYTNGIAKTFDQAIAGTDNDALYITERSINSSDTTISYSFPLNPDTYEVRLHFAEIYWDQPNQRIFDVLIEGQTALDEYDIVADVGASTAVIKTISNISVTDGTLNIDFPPATQDKPKISAIEIYLSACVDDPSLCANKANAVTDTVEVHRGSSKDIAVMDNDTGNMLQLVSFTTPAHGNVETVNTNMLKYTHDGTETSSDSFTYTIADSLGRESVGTVSVIIIPENDAPITTADSIIVDEGGTATKLVSGASSVLENDSDNEGDPLTAEVAINPSHGTLILNSDGTFSYTHNGSETTADSFEYKALDGQGGETIGVVSIQINPVEDGNITPGNPEISTPLDEGEILPTFNWISNSNAEHGYYHIVIFNGSAIILDIWLASDDVCEGSQCAFTPDTSMLPGGLTNGDYTWWIGAWDEESGDTHWSDGLTFEVDVPVPALAGILVDPHQGRPIISWANDPNMTWFQIYVGNALIMHYYQWHHYSDITCDEQRCQFEPNINPLAGSYDVWIRGWGPGGFTDGIEGGWQGPVSFSLPDTPPEPLTGLTFSAGNVLTFTWVASEHATWYQIWIGSPGPEWQTDYLNWHLLDDLNCDSGFCNLVVPSLPTTPLVWYVRAWGPGGFTLPEEMDGWTEGKPIPKR